MIAVIYDGRRSRSFTTSPPREDGIPRALLPQRGTALARVKPVLTSSRTDGLAKGGNATNARAVAGSSAPPKGHRFMGCAKTLSFSKQRQMLEWACAWEDLVYNFAHPVKTLRLPAPVTGCKWLKRSPAMAAGLTDHVWSMAELLTTLAVPGSKENHHQLSTG